MWSEYDTQIGKKFCLHLNIFDHILFNYWLQGENQPQFVHAHLLMSNFKFHREYIKWLVTPCSNSHSPYYQKTAI